MRSPENMLLRAELLTPILPPSIPPFRKVAGILLLNLSDQLERAREVLRLQPRISSVAQLKKLIALRSKTGGLIRVVDAPGSSLLGEP